MLKKYCFVFGLIFALGLAQNAQAAGRTASRRSGWDAPVDFASASMTVSPSASMAPSVLYGGSEVLGYEMLPPRSLFNGVDLTGWTAFDGRPPESSWTVRDGAIERLDGGDNLFTDRVYENFILDFEFKIDRGANSGIKYKTWDNGTNALGCEYQVYDQEHGSDKGDLHRVGALYDVYEPLGPRNLLRVGQYNRGRIVVMGSYVEHWLNGTRVVSAKIDSPEWKYRVAQSKFAQYSQFGHVQSGRIYLQDHNCPVQYRHLTIIELIPIGGSK